MEFRKVNSTLANPCISYTNSLDRSAAFQRLESFGATNISGWGTVPWFVF